MTNHSQSSFAKSVCSYAPLGSHTWQPAQQGRASSGHKSPSDPPMDHEGGMGGMVTHQLFVGKLMVVYASIMNVNCKLCVCAQLLMRVFVALWAEIHPIIHSSSEMLPVSPTGHLISAVSSAKGIAQCTSAPQEVPASTETAGSKACPAGLGT